MAIKSRGCLFFLFLIVLIVSWGCSVKNYSKPTAASMVVPTGTLLPDIVETANFLETASLKDIVLTDIPTVTATTSPVPSGTFALFFYSPLIMNYDPSIWEIKNVLRVKALENCSIGEQGPTDFNGPHQTEVVRLGNINYTILDFPDSAPNSVSHVYLADQAFVTGVGLPVFWVSAKSDEWDECKKLAEDVLATLHSPVH